jgi:hypothetical protein
VRTGHWKRIVGALDDPGAGKATRAASALEQAGRLISRRGLVVLVSDLLLEPDDVVRRVRALRTAGHQVAVLHILDPAERELATSGDAVFVDPESGEEVPATVADVRTAYRTTVAAALNEWRSLLGAAGASYETVLTDSPFGVPLRRAFAVRQRLP